MSADLFLGLDIGTSGARALLIDAAGGVVASGQSAMREQGPNPRDPRVWLAAASAALRGALAGIAPERVAALCVDGTSGTVLAADARGEPLGEALMYNDAAEAAGVLAIAEGAPDDSAAHGSTSALAKAMQLRALKPNRVLHQADWIASRFSGRYVTDANNALKTGYDPIASRWPDWIGDLGFNIGLLPEALAPGQIVGPVTQEAAALFGLSTATRVVAGTTDGCASFLATGASEVGDAVTALGTTLTLKLLSDRPIFSPKYGIYSHRLLGMWLAGGASNSGGGALLSHFTPAEMEALTPALDPDDPTGLDYYPLSKPGRALPHRRPRLSAAPDAETGYARAVPAGVAGRRHRHRGAGLQAAGRTRRPGAADGAHRRRRRAQLRLGPYPRARLKRADAAAALGRGRLRRRAARQGRRVIRARCLSDLMDRYDAFLVDQFGVLLDGDGFYDFARVALDEIYARGKVVLLLSNSGKRSAQNAARLAAHGVSRATYLDVLTSGEIAHLEMTRRLGDGLAPGARVWVETSDDSAHPLAGLDLVEIDTPEDADLLWIAGCRPAQRSLDDYAALLSRAAERRVPAICANPDTTMLTPGGGTFGAGQVAQVYTSLGGGVEWFGKPYAAIYEEALRRLGAVPPSRVLAIGDSPAHDVLGGSRAGLATALVRTGVHEGDSEAELRTRFDALGVVPDVILPRFAF